MSKKKTIHSNMITKVGPIFLFRKITRSNTLTVSGAKIELQLTFFYLVDAFNWKK